MNWILMSLLLSVYSANAAIPPVNCVLGLAKPSGTLSKTYGLSQSAELSAVAGLEIYTQGVHGRFRIPGESDVQVSIKKGRDSKLVVQFWRGDTAGKAVRLEREQNYVKPAIKATLPLGDRFFVIVGETDLAVTAPGARLLGFDSQLVKVVDKPLLWPQFGVGRDIRAERFIPMKVHRSTSNLPPQVLPAGGRLIQVRTEIDTYDLVPAIVRLDDTGLNLYRFDREGKIHSMWANRRYSALIRNDTVGPTNLQIQPLEDYRSLIFYTNELYLNSMIVEDSDRPNSHSMFFADVVPGSGLSSDEHHISHILPVQLTMSSGEVANLYWAQSGSYNGRLFAIDDSGEVVFVKTREKNSSALSTSFGSEIHVDLIHSLSDLVKVPNLFISNLPAQFIGHFLREDPQIREGGRYLYMIKGP